jgi:two-component system response regulator NreC
MASYLRLAPSPPPAEAAVASVPIRVVVADDHALLRRGLRLLLDHERDFEVIAEAGDLASAARHVERLRPAVLVLDLRMPDGSSVELIGRLRERVPQTAVVVLTMERDPGFARSAFAAGALGFVVKDQADMELPAAVRGAAHGQEHVGLEFASQLELPHRRTLEEA